MDPGEVRRLLRSHGLAPSRGLGQHFLLDERVAERAVEHADPSPDQTVLEVGPGLGVLTVPLAEAFGRVVAVEKDARLASLLGDRLEDLGVGNVEVEVGDVLDAAWPDTDKVVANLPYQISSPFTFRLLGSSIGEAVLMYQKEFAERLTAGPGSKTYGRLTVNAALRADREILETVPRGAFWPRPKVEGAVVRLVRRPPPFDVGDAALFDEVVRALFMHRRKQAKNALALHTDALGVTEAELEEALTAWGRGRTRPGDLTPEEIGALARKLASSD